MTDPSHPSSARKNMLVVAATLAAIAALNLYRHRTSTAEILGGLALALFLVAVVSPAWAQRFNRGWMGLAGVLGYVNTRILLSLAYYVIMTPFGMLLRLMGHDPLCRRGARKESYWIPRQTPRQPKDGFEHSF